MSSKLPSWSDAATLIKAYQNDALHIPTKNGEKLNGLMVDADHVREIIDNPDHTIKKLFMVFGMRGEGTDKEVNLVLMGVDEDDKVVPDPAYDFCDPCPTACSDLEHHL